MTRLRLLLRRLGGPDAISWPLFWVTLISSSVSHFAIPQPYVPLGLRAAGLVVAQIAMFAPLVAIRVLLQRRPEHSRPLLVLGAFALATVIRAAVLAELLRTPDGAVSVPFMTRLTGSVVQVFFVMIVTALIVSTTRAQASDLARLLERREQLSETRSAIERQMTEQNEAALARVQQILETELAALERADDRDQLPGLHRLAADVVRPLSHELAQSVPLWSPAASTIASPRVQWRQVHGDLSSTDPFRPGHTAITKALIMGAASVIYFPSQALLFLVTLVGSVWIAFTAANLVLRGHRGSATRFLLTGFIGAAVPASAVGLVLGGTAGVLLGVFGWLFLSGIAVLIGLVSSVIAAQRRTAEELEVTNRELRIDLVRLRQAQWFHQRALARALHGAVQSAVVAAAFRLEEAREHGTMTPQLLDAVRSDLAGSIDVLRANTEPPMPLAAFTAQLTDVWSRVAEITVDATPAAQHVLEDDAVLRAMVMEIASESVSNAIRHGRATSIDVRMSCQEGSELSLHVRSDDESEGGRQRSGLGSRLLDECTMDWKESSTGTRRILIARFPVDVRSPA